MVRNSDPSIMPDLGESFKIRPLSETEYIELARALLENTNVTNLQLDTATYTERSAAAMAEYVGTSKCIQCIQWNGESYRDGQESEQCQRMLCCFLPAFQESTSLKELHMELPLSGGGPSNLALKKMLTHTKSLWSLDLIYVNELLEVAAATAVRSGLKKNTSLRELTLSFSRRNSTVPPTLISLGDHTLLRSLCLHEHKVDLTGLKTFLESDTSKITELDIDGSHLLPTYDGLDACCKLWQNVPRSPCWDYATILLITTRQVY
jgi:hypothetical protein